MKSTFLRFLHLKEVLTGHDIDKDVDLISQRLLEVVAMKHSIDESFTVTDAMKLSDLASPATIHRRINELVISGYVTLEFKGGNRRSKFIVPTEKTDRYFDDLGKIIAQSLTVQGH